MDRWIDSALIVVFCIGVGHLWRVMTKQTNSRWTLTDWFSGVTLVTVVGVAYWLGGVPGEVANLNTQIAELKTDMRTGFSVLNTEVFQSDTSLKVRATQTDAELKRIGPLIIRDDFDAEIRRLNQEIDKLRDENRKLDEQLRGLIASLKK